MEQHSRATGTEGIGEDPTDSRKIKENGDVRVLRS